MNHCFVVVLQGNIGHPAAPAAAILTHSKRPDVISDRLSPQQKKSAVYAFGRERTDCLRSFSVMDGIKGSLDWIIVTLQ